MDQDVMFGTSFNGFNKQDVLSYIERTVNDYEAKIGGLNDRLKSAKDELEVKGRLYEGLLNKQKDLGAPEDLSEKIGNLYKVIADYDKKLEEYKQFKQKYDELEMKNQELIRFKDELIEQANQKILKLEDELAEYKSQKENIGGILIKAQRDADELVFRTGKKCDEAVLETQKYINGLKKVFEKYLDQLSLERMHVQNTAAKINGEFDEIFSYVVNAQKDFDDIIEFVKTPEIGSK